ncbi:histidine phosphatase family protein [Sphingomonas sp. 1P06PA]|uniref:SixA phosphatase family protein n=1 Tax=Sphingomonas sp. 1P06PA TaxID=554121 RepID=UPI0039A5EA6D
MKRLILFRHAKSGWDDPVARDFDRPLNAKGKRAARTMGQHLRKIDLRFDHLLASPAVRCVETLESFVEGYGETPPPAWDKRIYLASGVTLLDVVQEAPDSATSLMMCGHNPGLEDLALMLVPDRSDDAARDELEEKFPTASVAELIFEVDSWADVKANGATLGRFIRPRDLDSTLGPDQH